MQTFEQRTERSGILSISENSVIASPLKSEDRSVSDREQENQPTLTLTCFGFDFSALGNVIVNTPFFDSAEILL